MKKILKSQKAKDILLIICIVILYDLYILFPFENVGYLSIHKIIWIFITGIIAFVPMYFVHWLTLRKLNSKLFFLIISLCVWLFLPILALRMGNETYNSKHGGVQIYENGELTLDGYFYKLESPFLLLAVYAVIIFAVHLYRGGKNKS